jgi:hypothetical protein
VSTEAGAARELLADPVIGKAIRDRVATWPPVTAGVRAELERLLDTGPRQKP